MRARRIPAAFAAAALLLAVLGPAMPAAAAPDGTGDPFTTAPPISKTAASAITVSKARAAVAGTNGWYWPLGTESWTSFGHFMKARGSNWHLAQDMAGYDHQPVYAIADGVVLESGMVRGFGPGNGSGGAMVILHTTSTGRQFKALYGHIEGLRYKKGAKVRAGAQIAVLNEFDPPHLHFGIHPGKAYPPDRNPWRGHTYDKSNTHGWVDPVAFMRTYLRVAPYRPPALPLVGSMPTSDVPAAAWACEGWLYWSRPTGTRTSPDTTTWAARIPTSKNGSFCETETPAYSADTTRFAVSIVSTPTPLVRAFDRKPVATLDVSTSSPRKGRRFSICGRLSNAADQPFVFAPMILERKVGSSWKAIALVYTDKRGRWSAGWATSDSRTLRVRFAPPKVERPVYLPVISRLVAVAPH